MDEFNPDWYSCPGDTIRDILRERGMSAMAFKQQTGLSAGYVQHLLAGLAAITPPIADLLSKTLGASPQFWLKRDRTYWDAKAGLQNLQRKKPPCSEEQDGLPDDSTSRAS